MPPWPTTKGRRGRKLTKNIILPVDCDSIEKSGRYLKGDNDYRWFKMELLSKEFVFTFDIFLNAKI